MQRAPRLPHRRGVLALPGESLHACQTLCERHEPKARCRTPALMQRGQAIFGSFRKDLGRSGKALDTLAEDQHQLMQPLRTHRGRDRGEPRRVDGA